jgi:hypothetical protein
VSSPVFQREYLKIPLNNRHNFNNNFPTAFQLLTFFNISLLINDVKHLVCRDQPGQTAASNGIIQSILLSGQTTEQKCRFTIIAPPDYQIQMSCSVVVIVPYTNSYLTVSLILSSQVNTNFNFPFIVFISL